MNPSENKRGITLIEVMIGATLLALLAMFAATSILYPTCLVVNSSKEQSAINALNSGTECYLHNPQSPAPTGSFDTYGTPISVTITTNYPPDQTIPGTIGDDADFSQIEAEIEYNNNTLKLITYRSREISSSRR